MRDHAERLAKAAPERFEILDRAGGGWLIEPIRTPTARYWIKLWNDAGVEHAWAFWGTLADERNIRYVDCFKADDTVHDTLLEALAEAVCRSFEAEGGR